MSNFEDMVKRFVEEATEALGQEVATLKEENATLQEEVEVWRSRALQSERRVTELESWEQRGKLAEGRVRDLRAEVAMAKVATPQGKEKEEALARASRTAIDALSSGLVACYGSVFAPAVPTITTTPIPARTTAPPPPPRWRHKQVRSFKPRRKLRRLRHLIEDEARETDAPEEQSDSEDGPPEIQGEGEGEEGEIDLYGDLPEPGKLLSNLRAQNESGGGEKGKQPKQGAMDIDEEPTTPPSPKPTKVFMCAGCAQGRPSLRPGLDRQMCEKGHLLCMTHNVGTRLAVRAGTFFARGITPTVAQLVSGRDDGVGIMPVPGFSDPLTVCPSCHKEELGRKWPGKYKEQLKEWTTGYYTALGLPVPTTRVRAKSAAAPTPVRGAEAMVTTSAPAPVPESAGVSDVKGGPMTRSRSQR
ncbi:MAG: hypothetical protein Marn2KO_36680 [Marinobacter nauticus]